MCISCLALDRLFNNSFKNADQSLTSRLREKRELFINAPQEVKHILAEGLVAQNSSDEIGSDSKVLDGKTWDEILKDSFQARSPSPFPPASDAEELEKILQEIDREYAEQEEIISKLETTKTSFDPYTEPFYTTQESTQPSPKAAPITTYCSHDWFEYQGAGTKAPETICRHCGLAKSPDKPSR